VLAFYWFLVIQRTVRGHMYMYSAMFVTSIAVTDIEHSCLHSVSAAAALSSLTSLAYITSENCSSVMSSPAFAVSICKPKFSSTPLIAV
jgi:hypothetical protein